MLFTLNPRRNRARRHPGVPHGGPHLQVSMIRMSTVKMCVPVWVWLWLFVCVRVWRAAPSGEHGQNVCACVDVCVYVCVRVGVGVAGRTFR